jgi:RNA polymerase sigma-70 factor (ECF subfamily)
MVSSMTDQTASVSRGIAAQAEWQRAELRLIENKVIHFFDQFRHPLLRYLSAFRLPVHEAEEIVQDVFLALFRHLRRGKSEENLRAWIFRVGHNLALKRREGELLRSVGVSSAASEALAVDPSPSPEALAVENQTRRRILLALEALPERDNQCLQLRAEGLRFREIAKVLGISVGAVSISLTRSLARLARVANR